VKVSKISDYFFLIVEVYPNLLQNVENAHGKKTRHILCSFNG